MAVSTNISNFDAALKQIYRDANVEKLTYRYRPLLGMFNKFEGFGGRNMPIVCLYGNPQGIARDFARAQENRSEVGIEDFLLVRVNHYGVSTITGETIEATRGDKMAFLNALRTKIDTTMNGLADKIEALLFREGYGALTTVGEVSGLELTLSQSEEDPLFEINQVLVFSDAANPDGNPLLGGDPPDRAKITGINRTTGVLTTSGSDWTTQITGLDAGDYIFIDGDPDGAGGRTCPAGLLAWLPDDDPVLGSDSFFGVDRGGKSRLYGLRHDGTSESLESGAIRAQSKAAKQGGHPDCYIIHHSQYRRFILEVESKKEYNSVNAMNSKGMIANIAYRSLVVHGDHGPIDVIAANKCPVLKGFMLTKYVWTLNTLGKPMKILMEDDLRILRQATEDGYEVRMGFRGNLSSKGPIWNVNVSLPNPA